jgi:hypothetical protein
MGPVKLKPVTKQDEATKLILKQLEFINMLIKYFTQIYKLLVIFLIFFKDHSSLRHYQAIKKITQNESELFYHWC